MAILEHGDGLAVNEIPEQLKLHAHAEILQMLTVRRCTFFDTLQEPDPGDWDGLGLMSGRWLETCGTA